MKQKNSEFRNDATADSRWAVVVARDAARDGEFVYSVSSTGVYCRPSCASRQANPKHVRFHGTAVEAEAAGFRACKRCQPNGSAPAERYADIVLAACRRIEAADVPIALAELARGAGLSESHFHRIFKSVTGLTPREYAGARRSERVRANLSAGQTVTDAMFDAGYSSSGRFYQDSNEVLGMKPKDFRAGGANSEVRFAIGQCSLGAILVARSEIGIVGITLGDDPEALLQGLQRSFPHAQLIGGDADFEKLVARVVGFIEQPGLGLDLPLDVRGTAFQQRVWQALRQIPAGSTASYADIAKAIGSPKSVRAVAGACAANPIGVAIPCHRVVRSDGGISGYRWGVERKRELLQREAASMPKK